MNKMKDSGVEWIGEIPEEWDIRKLKFATTIHEEKYTSGNYQYIALENVESLSGKYIQTYSTYDLTGSKIADCGDVIFGKLRPYLGKILEITKKVCVSNEFAIFHGELINSTYLKYYMLSPGFLDSVTASTYGTKMPRANIDFISSCPITIPPTQEQQQISARLDQKCSQIDALITNQQTQIEKLKAYKQSVITEVVTKGLDPTVPMKDSSVEWIGDIPAHWIANKIIRCFGVIGSGTTPKSADDSLFEGDINWIQSGDINGSILSETRFQITKDVVNETSALKIYSAPFIVIAMYGASIGNLSISRINACTNQACCVLSKPVEGLLLEYLFYAFKPAKDFLTWKADGGGQPNISQDKVKSLWIPIPPAQEQERIIQYLNVKCGQIDDLIAIKQAKIEKLNQYKRSLIYEYVTGKKEAS
ncbi:restriction endonuclease subunit S [Akkermansia sp.]|uniref:restriction endonuclease subunit S n=1 Tax=Akkermansia sp. TaxID=1872421 RepID=UPI0025C060F2|nr:restriction endonuclease subunit S [Akkermansia sp.]